MASDGSPISSDEATQLLKNMLNVGKSHSESGGETSTASLASDIKGAMEGLDSSGTHISADDSSGNNMNGSVSYSEILQSMQSGGRDISTKQQILLHGNDNHNSFSVYGQDVTIVASSASAYSQSTPGSNKVKISPVVKFDWEHKYHVGRLVSIHRNSLHVAYVLRSRGGGAVRVIHRRTAERALLKNFVGQVVDLAFAQLSNVVLGAVDEIGNMLIHEFVELDGKMVVRLLLHVSRPAGTAASPNHRLIWCPYIPEDDSETDRDDGDGSEDAGKLLVLTHDEVVEMWNVDMVTRDYGSGPLEPSEVDVGYLVISHHSQAVVDAAYSPDGTALATASLDGEVKFFQVYLHDKSAPRCLHQWLPHNGEPISSLFFLDDHKSQNPEVQFWKFAVTGANFNREVKIWSCETWSCLQTLRFAPSPDPGGRLGPEPSLAIALDLRARYLLLSDIQRKVLYVLHVHQAPDQGRAHVDTLAEFLLTQPCLSMAVLDASRRRFRRNPDLQDHEEVADLTTGEVSEEGEDGEEVDGAPNGPDIGVLVRLYSVHTKALQELQIRYRPESSLPHPATPLSSSSFSQDEPVRDHLSDMSVVSEADVERARPSNQENAGAGPLTTQPMLLTPDAFTSPRNAPDNARSSGGSSISSLTAVTALDEDLRTPHTSVAAPPSITSPSSSLTLTPASSRDYSVIIPSSGTPPHPPPADSASFLPPEAPLTPPRSNISQDFVTSSPASHHLQQASDFLPPSNVSFSKEEKDEGEGLNSSHDSSVEAPQRHKLQSTGSSSSASLEVSEILEGAKKPGHEMPYEEEEEEEEEQEEEEEEQEEEDEEEEEEKEDKDEDDEDEDELDQDIPEEIEQQEDDDKPIVEEDSEEEGVKVEEPKRPEYDSRIWPRAPVVSNEAELGLEARMLAAEAIHRASQPAPPPPGPSASLGEISVSSSGEVDPLHLPTTKPAVSFPPPSEVKPPVTPQVDPAVVLQLQASVQSMVSLLEQQVAELSELRAGLHEQRVQAQNVLSLQEHIAQLEAALASKVTGALSQHAQTEAERLQRALGERAHAEREKHDQLLTTLTRTLEATISAKLERVVKDEIRSVVVPAVGSMIEPFKAQLHAEMAQKLTATDALMRENIAKLVRSKPTIESIGNAVGGAMQGPLQATCRDILIPSFDRGCNHMFQQLNQGFQTGLRQYSDQLENHLEKVRRRHEESRDPIVSQLQSLLDGMREQERQREPLYQQMSGLGGQLASTLEGLSGSLEAAVERRLQGLEERLPGQLRTMVREEVGQALRQQQTSLNDQLTALFRSATPTTPSTPDPQQMRSNVAQLLREGEVNAAFQQALSASDLNLVIFVCEMVNPTQLFEQDPCPLQQPVLLSLIQQLSADFHSNLPLKLTFLQETLMKLEPTNPVTREHMPAVVGQLVQKLNSFLQANPHHKLTTQIRMLMMACQSLLRK